MNMYVCMCICGHSEMEPYMVKNEFLAWICTAIMILGKNIVQNHGITMVGVSNPTL